jgi:hypothetical protein
MALPTPSGGTLFKATCLYNEGNIGFSETAYCTATDDNPNQFTADLKALVRTRLAISVEQVSFVGARVSVVGNPGITGVYEPSDLALFTGTNGSNAEFPSLGVLSYVGTPGGAYHRTMITRGLDALDVTYDPANPGTPVFSATFKSLIQQYYAVLRNSLIPGGGKVATWCILALSKDPTINGKKPLFNINTSANGCFFTFTSATSTLTLGQKVRMSGAKGRGLSGFNGSGIVLDVETVGGITTYTVSRSPKCCGGGPFFSKTQAYVKPSVKQPFAITSISPERFSDRKTGRSFGVTPGRRPTAGCC